MTFFMPLSPVFGGRFAVPVSLGTSTASTSPTSSGTCTTTANIQAGDLAFVIVALNVNNVVSVSTISDGTNSYSKAIAFTSGAGGSSTVEIWYKANCAAVASGATITVTLNTATTGASAGFTIAAYRTTGGKPTLPLDQVATNGGGAILTTTATTAALARTTDIAIGASLIANGSPSYSGATGFTNILNATLSGGNGQIAVDYQILNSGAALSYSPTWGATSNRLCAAVATFLAT